MQHYFFAIRLQATSGGDSTLFIQQFLALVGGDGFRLFGGTDRNNKLGGHGPMKA